MHGARIDAGQSIGRSCRRPPALAARGLPRPAIACCFEVSSSAGYDLCSRRRALRVASSIAAGGDHCRHLRRHRPAQVTADNSSIAVGTLTPTSRDTSSTEELPGWTAAGIVGGNLIQLAPGTQPG